jgi:dihydroceramidase
MSHWERGRLFRDGEQFSSNIVWCEEKFAYSRMIAEFWNTISNFPFILAGIYYLIRSIGLGVKLRYRLCYMLLILMGLGSATFHATLSWHGQLLDETPMMLLFGQAIWCIINNDHNDSDRERLTTLIILGSIVCGTTIYLFWNQFYVFHLLFGCLILAAILGTIRMCKRIPKARKPMLIALLTSVSAMIMWICDSVACEALRSRRQQIGRVWGEVLQLHAWWHLISCVAIAWFITGLIVAHPSTRHLKIHTIGLVIPVLREASSQTSNSNKT